MDIKKYEVFLKAVDRGSFNNVSNDLGYTHSGVSKMMNSMENELGFPLINRNNKGITLTPEGEEVIMQIRKVVRENERLEEQFSLIRGVERGTVRIGSFPTISIVWMPKLLSEFSKLHPGIQIEVIEDNSIEDLEQALNKGIIDIGIFSKQPYHNFTWFNCKTDDYVALISRNHPMAQEPSISVKELFEEDVVLFKNHKGFDQDVIQLMEHVDLKKYSGHTLNSDLTVIKMVEESDFVTIIPRLIAEYATELFDVTYRPMDKTISREIGMAVKSKDDLSPSVKCFLDFTKGVI